MPTGSQHAADDRWAVTQSAAGDRGALKQRVAGEIGAVKQSSDDDLSAIIMYRVVDMTRDTQLTGAVAASVVPLQAIIHAHRVSFCFFSEVTHVSKNQHLWRIITAGF